MGYFEDVYKMNSGYETYVYHYSYAIPTVIYVSKTFGKDRCEEISDWYHKNYGDSYESKCKINDLKKYNESQKHYKDMRHNAIDICDDGYVFVYSDMERKYLSSCCGQIILKDCTIEYVMNPINERRSNESFTQYQAFKRGYSGEKQNFKILTDNNIAWGDEKYLTKDQWNDISYHIQYTDHLLSEKNRLSIEIKRIDNELDKNSKTVEMMMMYLSNKIYHELRKKDEENGKSEEN